MTKLRNNIHQSIVAWCYQACGDQWSLDRLCEVAKDLGCDALEIVPSSDWGTLKKHGLKCVLSPNGMPGAPFVKGFNNKAYHEQVVACMLQAIQETADAGFPNVIAFTGYKWRDAEDPTSGEISRDECLANCVEGLKRVAGLAERLGVNVCLEHLNTRDGSHPMKGHPGYQGDDLELVAEIIRTVGSSRIRLLFDFYHVQIMHGDVMRRIEENIDIIGHVHVAGNPGRNELDDNQEINFPPLLRKLHALGYQGYVGQEFIPTRDAYEGLRQAITLCDI
ncbi:MAG: hydroxypyruvate isomerase family protein [Pirellula sp.]|jgi:hydroxypyruvate isomerase